MTTKFSDTSIVLTNLSCLLIHDLRIWCKTLILNENVARWERTETRRTLAAYGSTCAWKVMDRKVDTLAYRLKREEGGHAWKLRIDDMAIEIHPEDYTRDLDVERFEIRADDVDELSRHHANVGAHVLERACRYQRAPNIGGAVFGPPEMMRDILAKFS